MPKKNNVSKEKEELNEPNEPRRLYRSKKDKVIAGVCGGIAEYFKIDPVWVRLIAVVLIFFDGVGVIAYILAWILMPRNPNQPERKKTKAERVVDEFKKSSKSEKKMSKEKRRGKGNILFGIIIIFIGGYFLLKNFYPWFSFNYVWPVLIIIIGIHMLLENKNA